ncbi:hypothetical protein COT72_05075 [archaeon CG10_big_fil_rev_8_21_14_0_10_43_11]|nr:MAG: hypothetical protein COT72_05075 [archaeon CG10_big_fil_rev_8_21_14_0_10_43_11]
MVAQELIIKLGIFSISLFIMLFLSKYLVDALIHFSQKVKLSEFLVGSVILALGTSMPELIDNIIAASIGVGELGVGDLIGSNITNIALILGVSAIIQPIRNIGKNEAREAIFPFLAAVLYLLVAYDGVITRLNGVLLLVVYFGYQFYLRKKSLGTQQEVYLKEIQADIILTPIAIFTIIICGWLVVNTGASLAQDIGIPLSVFGLTILALSTSLPELSAGVISSLKGHSKISLGNVFGSNSLNLTLIGGIAALIHPITLNNVSVVIASLIILIGLSALVVLFTRTKRNITKKEGIFFLLIYVAYLLFIILTQG